MAHDSWNNLRGVAGLAIALVTALPTAAEDAAIASQSSFSYGLP